jgi:hypothetical protein
MSFKRTLAAGVAVSALTLLATGAQAANITLYNTGVGATGTPLAEGAADTHWVVNPLTNPTTPVVYDHPAYLVPTDARFIAVQSNGGYVVNPNTFTQTFSLAGFNAATATLSGKFEADNYASVYLNGHLISQDIQDTVYPNFQSFTDFSASSADFVSGLNTLSFVVTDTGPPAAFAVSQLVGTASAVPEPAIWATMLMGMFGLGSVLRINRRKPAFAAV